ncbi:hypothetical protein EI42_05517 [Thermosporothrix hazakensis]|uniref:Zinc ribbon protein n=2 Tax=Thermosporothrix hazakensis TaxID=644383 RepID=A0A326TZS8_THEHA|nr:hypothetical protein EI42_05517 [Thermosporothrix hazakensis]GCE49138.1 hypothetical protein KTH_40070 [Thermosporothrix hazakensis]
MQCKKCGATVPSGAYTCPVCGTPQGYTNYPPGANPNNSPSMEGLEPTVLANQSGDAYNAQDPYNGGQQYGSGSSYAPPPPSYQQGPPPYGSTPQGPGGFYAPPPRPPKKNTGLIIGVIVAVLVVIAACGGLGAWALSQGRDTKTADSDPTPTTEPTQAPTSTVEIPTVTLPPSPTSDSGDNGDTPSGKPISPTAAAIILNAQTASAIDEESAKPTKTTSTFKLNSDVYITFDLNASKSGLNFKQGDTAYIGVVYYLEGVKQNAKADPLKIDSSTYTAPGGYFGITYKLPGEGAAELYWCRSSSCSDGELAQVVHFTITA